MLNRYIFTKICAISLFCKRFHLSYFLYHIISIVEELTIRKWKFTMNESYSLNPNLETISNANGMSVTIMVGDTCIALLVAFSCVLHNKFIVISYGKDNG